MKLTVKSRYVILHDRLITSSTAWCKHIEIIFTTIRFSIALMKTFMFWSGLFFCMFLGEENNYVSYKIMFLLLYSKIMDKYITFISKLLTALCAKEVFSVPSLIESCNAFLYNFIFHCRIFFIFIRNWNVKRKENL